MILQKASRVGDGARTSSAGQAQALQDGDAVVVKAPGPGLAAYKGRVGVLKKAVSHCQWGELREKWPSAEGGSLPKRPGRLARVAASLPLPPCNTVCAAILWHKREDLTRLASHGSRAATPS